MVYSLRFERSSCLLGNAGPLSLVLSVIGVLTASPEWGVSSILIAGVRHEVISGFPTDGANYAGVIFAL